MPSNEISIWDLVGIINRHRFAFIATLLATMALAIAANVFLPKKYRSEAHLLVRLGSENLGLDSTLKLTEQSTVNVTQSREFEMKTVANLVAEYSNYEKVVDRLGTERILGKETAGDRFKKAIFGNEFMSNAFAPSYQFDDRTNAIRKLTKKMKVRMIPETHMVGIYYDHKNPEIAQEAVAALVDFSLAHHAATHRNEGSLGFIVDERDQAKRQLDELENELKEFKSETGLISVAEQRVALVGRISSLKAQLMDSVSSLAAINKEIESLEKSVNNIEKVNVSAETSGAGNRAVDQMRSDLYKLQLEAQALASKYSEEHVLVLQKRKQIEAAQSIMDSEENKRTQTTMSPSREYQETNILLIQKQAQAESLNTKAEQIRGQLAVEQKALVELDANGLEIKRREREIELLASNYHRYSRESEHARVDESLGKTNMSNLSVAQPATLNHYPVFPNVPLNLAIGMVLSLFFACLACVVLDTWNYSRNVEQEAVDDDDDLPPLNGQASTDRDPEYYLENGSHRVGRTEESGSIN